VTAPVLKYSIGIDPGITGAVALVRYDAEGTIKLEAVFDLPTVSKTTNARTKQEVNLPALANMLRQAIDVPFPARFDVFLEDVHAMPGQGVTSMFRFGHVAGAIEGIVAALKIPMQKVQPKQWQALVRVRKEPDAGRLRASQMFPAQADLFARKKDHNRADAALIACAGVGLLTSRVRTE
jgi:crossover junction endodeoxyribonuclease RuvC